MISVIEKLQNSVFFKGLSQDEIRKIVKELRYSNKYYKKGEIIANEEDECNAIGFIIKGEIEIQRIYYSGKSITLNKFYSGEVFGEALVFSSHSTYPATIMAAKPCNIVFIKREDILSLCLKDKHLLENFMGLLSDKLLILNSKIKSISFKTVRAKVVNYILNKVQDPDNLVIELKDSKESIANYIGIPRPSFSRELIKLRDEGLIEFDRKTITILEIERLENEIIE